MWSPLEGKEFKNLNREKEGAMEGTIDLWFRGKEQIPGILLQMAQHFN